jgi:SAM-dependent methyltransferase
MARPFVEHYDELYADKDYDADIAAFESLAGPLAGRTVLEIGAGTGNHSRRLAARAAALVSVETDPDFGEILQRKGIPCFLGSLQGLPQKRFDAGAAFFDVLNYIEQMPAFLAALAERLKPGAPFVADLWNPAAVASDPPRAERREKAGGVVQEILPTVLGRRVTLEYRIRAGGQAFTERLALHLWYQEELKMLLEQAGFADIAYWDYRRFPAPADERSWKLWLRATRQTETGK